jgi:hypothetical protein
MMELSAAAKEARRAYKRQWAAANPDKVREQQRRHWEKVAREMEGGPGDPDTRVSSNRAGEREEQ